MNKTISTKVQLNDNRTVMIYVEFYFDSSEGVKVDSWEMINVTGLQGRHILRQNGHNYINLANLGPEDFQLLAEELTALCDKGDNYYDELEQNYIFERLA